jgi:hypothetical protein
MSKQAMCCTPTYVEQPSAATDAATKVAPRNGGRTSAIKIPQRFELARVGLKLLPLTAALLKSRVDVDASNTSPGANSRPWI